MCYEIALGANFREQRLIEKTNWIKCIQNHCKTHKFTRDSWWRSQEFILPECPRTRDQRAAHNLSHESLNKKGGGKVYVYIYIYIILLTQLFRRYQLDRYRVHNWFWRIQNAPFNVKSLLFIHIPSTQTALVNVQKNVLGIIFKCTLSNVG